MRQPLFNWKTYAADYNELCSGAKMNVGEITQFRIPKENELIRMLCFKSGIRQTKELQNWQQWNGCVYVDVDYKNYMNANENATRPTKVFSDVYNYLVEHYSQHFYYGELSRSKQGFHFIFYVDTDNPSEERREYLNLMANAAIIKAFYECGYKKAIEYKEIKNGIDTCKVLDTCTNSPYQICYITGIGKINDRCNADWKIHTDGLKEIIDKLKDRQRNKKTTTCKNGMTYKPKLLRKNEVQSVPYIEHLVRRNLFKSLSTLYSGEQLREEWERCARLIPEEHGHTAEYYISAPYKNDWNDSLSDHEYCDKNLLRMFGYDIQIISYYRQLTIDEIMTNIYNIIQNDYE